MLPICSKRVHNIDIASEGTVSQISYLRVSFDFILKNGKVLLIFSNILFYISFNKKLRPLSKI